MKAGRALALSVGLAAVVRAPFWVETLHIPVDADIAIIGLMARHHGLSASMWGQPYGSPVEAWLAQPFFLLLGPTAVAMRWLYFSLGLALVPIAYALGRALDARAALPAALLVACPPSYMLLLSSLPPPLYPVTLVLCGLLLVLAIRAGARLERGERPWGHVLLWGLASGLALWTHLMAASAVAASGVYLLRRATGRRGLVTAAVLALAAASAPLWTSELSDQQIWKILRVRSRAVSLPAHFAEVLPQLHVPLGGLLGAHVPVIADSADQLSTPLPVAIGLLALYAASLAVALRACRQNPAARMLLLCALLAVIVFVVPLRSGPSKTRFLTPLYLPLSILTAWAWAGVCRRRRGLGVLVAIAALNLVGAAQLRAAWHVADHGALPFGVRGLQGVQAFLEEHKIRRAFGSYEIAYRLTFASRERIIVSQPWNERFEHERLPYLDEVHFSRNVAWILDPTVQSGLPTPRSFETALAQVGGSFRKVRLGSTTVYFDFVPPLSPNVRAVEAPPSGAASILAEPLALEAITLLGEGAPGVLPRVYLEWSADGKSFARAEAPKGAGALTWTNGHPGALLGSDVVTIPLAGRRVAAFRIESRSPDWKVSRVLLHPAEDRGMFRQWDEWLDPNLDWAQRAAVLRASPRPDREDWHYRVRLAERNR